MKIIALEKESSRARPENYESLLKAEAQKVCELQQAGGLREIYFRADQSLAVIIPECGDPGRGKGGTLRFAAGALRPY